MTGNPDASDSGLDIEKVIEYLIDKYREEPSYFDFDEELRLLIETVLGNRDDDYGG